MRTAAVNEDDNTLFIAFTTHILQSYRTNLAKRDRALFLPHKNSSEYSAGHHAAAATLLRSYSVRDALNEDYDELAASILPGTYTAVADERGVEAAAGNAVPLSSGEEIAVQVYLAYRRAKTELAATLDRIVTTVVQEFEGGRGEKRALMTQMRARNAVDVQRHVLQRDIDATVQRYRGVKRLGHDERGDRIVFLEKVNGRWEEM